MISRIIILLLIAQTGMAYSGSGETPPVKWGKVTPSEFAIQSSDHAIVLCDYGTIEISNRTFYSRHTRIKIMDEAGFEYAVVEIPYETFNNHDDFSQLQAQTILNRNGKTIKHKVKPNQIEDIKINDNLSKKKFVFPNVEPGAIIEFRYVIASLDFEKLDEWYFQREIPTMWSEIRFQVPEPFVYLVTFQNSRQLSLTEEENFSRELQWLYETGRRARDLELARQDHVLYVTTENRYKVWIMNGFKKTIVMRNLPGLAESDGNPVSKEYYARLRFHLFESYGNLPRVFRPLLITTLDDYRARSQWELMNDMTAISGFVHYRLKTWPEMNEDLLGNERFGLFLVRTIGRSSLLDSILADYATGRDKIVAVYDFIRNTFKWNGEYSMYTTMDFDELISGRSGSSADLNLLLINMLRRAGIQADPLLIRTNDLGMPERMYPVKDQFNHVIAVAYSSGQQILLDATSRSVPYYMLNDKDIDTIGWIVNDRNPGWIDIYQQDDLRDVKKGEAPDFKL